MLCNEWANVSLTIQSVHMNCVYDKGLQTIMKVNYSMLDGVKPKIQAKRCVWTILNDFLTI